MRLWIIALYMVIALAATRCGDASADDMFAVGTITSTNPKNSICVFSSGGKVTPVKVGQFFANGVLTAVSRRYCFIGSTKYRVGAQK